MLSSPTRGIQSSQMMNIFVEASHLSERLPNLERNSIIVEKEPTTVHSNVDPLDDSFLQSDQPAGKIKGKFRPQPCKKIVKCVRASSDSTKTSFECNKTSESDSSFVLETNSNDHLRFSAPIVGTSNSEIYNLQNSVSDQFVNLEMLDSNIINTSTNGVAGPISTLNLDSTNFEPICVLSQLEDTQSSLMMNEFTEASQLSERLSNLERNSVIVGKQPITMHSNVDLLDDSFLQSDQPTDLKDRTKNAEAISSNSPGLIDFGSSDVDSLHIRSVATCNSPITQTDVVSGNSQLDSLPINSKSLDAHGPGFLADDLMKSLQMEGQSYFFNNSSGGNNNDLHIKEPNLEEHAPSIVQNDEAEKSSKRVGQRKRKFKSSTVDNISSEDQNSQDTISGMDEGYDDDDYNFEDMPEKKKMKASKKALGKPDSTIKDPPKKRLPHGSRRKNTKRRETKALFKFPDDKPGRRQLAIRDLIKLAGFKEQISNKEATALKKTFDNQSEEHEQDSDTENAERYIHRKVSKYNYHSHMRRPQKARWSNAETELFYQAIEQFGTDFTMIKILFPGRIREQVKAKFKNEQRKHPLQIADAIVYRSRDHSHFQKVIQHLQAVDELNSKTDSIDPSINSQDEAD